jgi:hypothetical protein
MMGTVMVPETLVIFNHLTQLIAPDYQLLLPWKLHILYHEMATQQQYVH